MSRILCTLAGMRNYLSFFLTFYALTGAFAAHFYKDTSIEVLIPTILGIYVAGRTTQKASAHMAASKDPTADTKAIIAEQDDR